MLKKIHKFETLKKASDFKILVKKFPFSFIIKNDKTENLNHNLKKHKSLGEYVTLF